MTICTLETKGSIALLTMTNGENRHNPTFANEMKLLLNTVLENDQHKALVIASNDEKCWSLGIDTDWLMPAMQHGQHDQVRKFMHDMDEVFKSLLLFPIPVIASINGHAFGNGAIMACACDFRFMRSDRGYFCFPEVDLSIPFLPGMLDIVNKAVPSYRLNEMMLTGRRATAADLEKDNVLEQAFADQILLHQGVEKFARTFDKKRAIFGELKKRQYRDIVVTMETLNPPIIEALQLTV